MLSIDDILARPDQSLYMHIFNMLTEFRKQIEPKTPFFVKSKFKDYNDSQKKIIQTIFDNSIYYLILIHDFGKFNPWFQHKFNNRIEVPQDKSNRDKKTLSFHTQLGSLIQILGKDEYIRWIESKISDHKTHFSANQKEHLKCYFGDLFLVLNYCVSFHHERKTLHNDLSCIISNEGGFSYGIMLEIIKSMNNTYYDNLEKIKIFYQRLADCCNNKIEADVFKIIIKSLEKLSSLDDEDEIWDIYDEIQDKWENITKKQSYLFDLYYCYSILCDLDEWDAKSHVNNTHHHFLPFSFDSLYFPANIIKEYRGKKFPEIDPDSKDQLLLMKLKLWEKSEEILLDGLGEIINIQFPTGSAKTLAYLNIAFKKLKIITAKYSLNSNFQPKIIYCLPFVSITDQVGNEIWDIFTKNDMIRRKFSENFPKSFTQSELLGVHHHLATRNWTYMAKPEDFEENFQLAKDAFTLWKESCIVTTFVSFWEGIIKGFKRNLLKFHRLMGSIIILDEIQSIPIKYWKTISFFIHYLVENFNCTFIVGSATFPKAITKTYPELKKLGLNVKIQDIYQNYQKYPLKRYEGEFIKNPIKLSEFEEFIVEKINGFNCPSKTMIVMNTRWSAKWLYNVIKSKSENNDQRVFFLSSALCYKDRLKIIENVKNSEGKAVLICTQVIEAGVDLSFDLVIRDFAPLDSIIQVAGRCNRYNKELGKIFIVKVENDIDTRRGKFFSNIYDSILLNCTREMIERKSTISEPDLYKLISDYYYQLSESDLQRKITNEGLEAFKKMEIQKLTRDFKLIDEDHDGIFGYVDDKEILKDLQEKFYCSSITVHKKTIFKYLRNSISLSNRKIDALISCFGKNSYVFFSWEQEGNKILLTSKDIFANFYDPASGLNIEWL